MTTEDTSQSNAILFIDSKNAFEHDGVGHYQLKKTQFQQEEATEFYVN